MTHPILRVEALEARTVPATLPPGFAESVLAAGLTAPTGMAVAPDGRVFVAEQAGTLRVIRNGTLLPAPFVTLTVDPARERGLIGVALDPAFAANGFVYLYHTVPAAGGRAPFNRISRFTATGDVAAAGSRADLLDLDPLSAAGNHNGGPMQFGPDGKLYVAVGENANPANSQSLGTRLGKILRLNPDGSVPADNPTTFDRLGTVPAPTAIWAAGLRNPFALAFEPGTGRLLINDVGQLTFEEINAGRAGANYGWNLTEGPDPAGVSGVTYPVYSYPHAGPQPFAGNAVTGGAFLGGAGFPGGYYFADFASRWVNRLDPATGAVTNFATDLTGGELVDLDVGPAGELLYLSRETGAVHRIAATSPPAAPPPVIAIGTGAGTASAAKLVDAAGATRLAAAAFGGGFTGGVRWLSSNNAWESGTGDYEAW
ncbi:MAG: PQQ-dependent sugar dehydrogenase, partial [Gemmataceae bacterium]|nr:PQQ-dependent sugar dehydrogenase [Gemmataceae bacterium]